MNIEIMSFRIDGSRPNALRFYFYGAIQTVGVSWCDVVCGHHVLIFDACKNSCMRLTLYEQLKTILNIFYTNGVHFTV